jgi:hypothetical protein
MKRLMLDKQPWPFIWIKIWDEGASGNKWWALSFNILFKFEIDNERSGIVICQCWPWMITPKVFDW